MESALDFYLSQPALVPHFPQVEGLRREAQAALKAFGFPTRRDEDWKYSPADEFCKQRFEVCDTPGAPLADSFPSMPSYLMSGQVLQAAQLPEGVIVLPWADALMLHAEKIGPILGRILKDRHGFHAQNTAMLSRGLFIYLPKNIVLTEPLRLVNWQNQQKASYLRHLVVLEEGASATFIEDYQGESEAAYYTNVITEVMLHPRASLKHYKVLREGRQAYHFGQLAVRQAAHSFFETHSFAVGGQWVRSDIDVEFVEPHASCVMNGIYMTEAKQHLDHHTKIYHRVPHCNSEQDYKGLVTGHSHVVFNGIVHVSPKAIKTVAHQSNKNLLLSKHAEVDTKPQLEIYADDVVCTHGATVGQLDHEALFYLETRGIPLSEAHSFLMRAFVEENLQRLGHPELSRWMSQLLNQQMGW